MTDIIQLLPDAIANQIAAGEVIQRPASVVKELVENAIDAKSTNIQVIIREAGKNLIQIIDDGLGMSATDARMSFERHATSKIRAAEDLFRIRTMGFRGEALASIAAIAQVELYSRQQNEELGTFIRIEGSEVKKQEPEVCKPGTSISVKNLFYNVPARRKFLKTNPVEMKHITDEFQKLALAHPEIEFSLYQNDLEVYNLKAGKISQRIVGLFGKAYREQLAVVQEDTEHLTIKGYLGKPEFAKKTRGEQFFFVNNRFIKSNYLNHAVMNAYEGLITDDVYPFYVLFLEIDPRNIDINVHPTKTEIKFDDERTVYGIIRSAIKQTLGTYNISPSLDFNFNINFNQQQGEMAKSAISEHHYGMLRTNPPPEKDKNLEHWESLYPGKSIEDEKKFMTLTSAANDFPDENNEAGIEADNKFSNTFQLHLQYIISPIKSGLMFINQQHAHERILYEKYLKNLGKRHLQAQQLLFPITIDLNPADFELVNDLQEEIENLGFNFSIFGKNSIVVQGVPVEGVESNVNELFESFIEQYKNFRSELSTGNNEILARSLASRCSLKKGKKLSNQEMKSIIDQLFACAEPNFSPGGQATFIILDQSKIAGFFNTKM